MADGTSPLGPRIRAYREALGYSLSDLAKKSGVSRSYLYQVESGTSSPTHEKLLDLAKALDVSVADLLGVGATKPDTPDVPESLAAYAEQAGLPSADIATLANIRYRGKQPTTVEGWRALHYIIKATTGEEP